MHFWGIVGRFIILVGTLCLLSGGALAREVRVGVYSNAPKIFFENGGKPAGIFIDLIERIAAEEKWQLRYHHCIWQECLSALQEGTIDLMPDVAFSESREKLFDFHKTPALHSWSQLYARHNENVISPPQLAGKRIALLRHSVQEENFVRWLDGFGVQVVIVPADSFDHAFSLVAEKKADFAVVNNRYGALHASTYHLSETPVVFQPAQLFYAARKGQGGELLVAIDSHLAAWQQTPDSPYFAILNKWRQSSSVVQAPPWALWAIGVLAVLLLLITAYAVYLQRELERLANMEASD